MLNPRPNICIECLVTLDIYCFVFRVSLHNVLSCKHKCKLLEITKRPCNVKYNQPEGAPGHSTEDRESGVCSGENSSRKGRQTARHQFLVTVSLYIYTYISKYNQNWGTRHVVNYRKAIHGLRVLPVTSQHFIRILASLVTILVLFTHLTSVARLCVQ